MQTSVGQSRLLSCERYLLLPQTINKQADFRFVGLETNIIKYYKYDKSN